MKLLCLLLCLLLCGCSRSAPVASLTQAAGTEAQAQASMTLRCGIPAYALESAGAQAIFPLGDGFLLAGGTLTALDSRFLTLGQWEDALPDFQIVEDGIACYLPQSRELAILDDHLEEIRRITLPQDIQGRPLISRDKTRIYYTTANALRVWDLDSGIRRRVMELTSPLTVASLVMEDTVLVCRTGQTTRFLNAQDGSLLRELTGSVQITSEQDRFFAALPQSTRTDYIFGTLDAPAQMLLPRTLSDSISFLPSQMAAVATGSEADTVTLEYYDLLTGALVDELSLPEAHAPKGILPVGENQVLLLVYDPEFDRDMLLTWTVSRTAPSATVYTGPYYTRQNPDAAALEGCRNYARQIASKYGITLLVGEEAAQGPWDYDLEPEHLERVLMENLKLLDTLLSRYPAEVLSQTADHFGQLNLGLVRQIRGTAASGSLDTATGVQYLKDGECCVALALGPYMEQALYHELFHAMEVCVYAKSTAFDHWDDLNPAGFAYDYDFSANAQRNAGIYLENGQRAFIDTYSMSYPREDRARIFEYACLPGNASLFQAERMQQKLQTICQGLRETYALEGGPFLWEQYLK